MRTFIHVHDIALSWLFAIDNADTMQNDVFNVGSDSLNYSKKEICDLIAEKTGAYFHFADIGRDADKRNYVVSYEKIKKLGFNTTITVEEGIDELVKASNAIVFKTPYTNV
jgi:nucleoside-diphosphate-sugar epimerase